MPCIAALPTGKASSGARAKNVRAEAEKLVGLAGFCKTDPV
jgi:hypothetical protein